MTQDGRIGVLIADDQALVRAGLVALIEGQPDLAVVGEAQNGVEAVTLARDTRPDVILMDIRMPVLDGIEATRQITAAGTGDGVHVVALTTYDLDEYVYDALRAGACGFLLKHALPEELLLGVRAAAAGGTLISPAMTKPLIEAFTGRRRAITRPPAALTRLTTRERQVLDLVVAGRTNTEIARTLTIAETTVKTHLARVLEKLGLRDRVHVVIYGYENGLVRPPPTSDT